MSSCLVQFVLAKKSEGQSCGAQGSTECSTGLTCQSSICKRKLKHIQLITISIHNGTQTFVILALCVLTFDFLDFCYRLCNSF